MKQAAKQEARRLAEEAGRKKAEEEVKRITEEKWKAKEEAKVQVDVEARHKAKVEVRAREKAALLAAGEEMRVHLGLVLMIKDQMHLQCINGGNGLSGGWREMQGE